MNIDFPTISLMPTPVRGRKARKNAEKTAKLAASLWRIIRVKPLTRSNDHERSTVYAKFNVSLYGKVTGYYVTEYDGVNGLWGFFHTPGDDKPFIWAGQTVSDLATGYGGSNVVIREEDYVSSNVRACLIHQL